MKKVFKFTSVVLFAAMSLTAVSCSDDDDDSTNGGNAGTPAPEQVFTAGVPQAIGDMKITTNAQGLITSISDDYGTVYTFEYLNDARAAVNKADFDVKITESGEYGDDELVMWCKLNERGFIKYVLEEYADEDDDREEWWFEYNKDGQLSYMKRTEGDNEVTTITYANGDITKVSVVDDDNKTPEVITIAYTSDKVKTAITNKGCLMFFDGIFNIDMDEMEAAYFAGLLGKATVHLPVKTTDSDGDFYEYAWTLNAAGLPTQMVETSTYGDGYTYTEEPVIFKW